MIVVLRDGAGEAEIAEVLRELERRGLRGQLVRAGARQLVHVVSGDTRRVRRLQRLEAVAGLIPTSGPRVRREGRRFYPYHFVNWSAVGVLALGCLVFLAGYLPQGIGPEIDYASPAARETPWYLRAPSAFVAMFPPALAWLAWLLLAAGGCAVLALPLLDRGERPGSAGSRWMRLALAAAVVAGAAALAWQGGPP